MATRKSQAQWDGKVKTGSGRIRLGDGTKCTFSHSSRFEQGKGTNPEELIAGAHAGCFSMALAHILEEEGYVPDQINTTASVTIEKQQEGFTITTIELETEGSVPKISEQEFERLAEKAKDNCPVSKVLAGADISVKAKLAQMA